MTPRLQHRPHRPGIIGTRYHSLAPVLKQAALALAFAWVTGTAAAQTDERVLEPSGKPVGEWTVRELCLGTARPCAAVTSNRETGEIALFEDRISVGFKRTSIGSEVVRDPAPRPQPKATRATQDDRVTDSGGVLIAPWTEIASCIGDTASCPKIVLNAQTREIASYNNKLSGGFVRTGNGLEIARKPPSTVSAGN